MNLGRGFTAGKGLSSAAPAAIIFNPANPLNVVDEGGFAGSSTVGSNPYSQARLVFDFTGLNPIPLPSTFQVTNTFLKGPGITGSISFADLTVTGNSLFFTSFANLSSTQLSVDLSSALVLFDLPGGGVINDGADLAVFVRYASANDFNVLTSSTGPVFEAQDGPAAIPELGTWAAAALLVGGAALLRWRKRVKVA